MGEFTTIETQEQFDTAIKARLDREKSKYEEKLTDYEATKSKLADAEKQIGDLTGALNSANEKIAGFDSQIAERDSKIATYEAASVKTRIAHEMGLSFDAIDFLQGTDEDSIRKSAESLKNLVGSNHIAPLANTEPLVATDEKAQKASELKEMLKSIRKGE